MKKIQFLQDQTPRCFFSECPADSHVANILYVRNTGIAGRKGIFCIYRIPTCKNREIRKENGTRRYFKGPAIQLGSNPNRKCFLPTACNLIKDAVMVTHLPLNELRYRYVQWCVLVWHTHTHCPPPTTSWVMFVCLALAVYVQSCETPAQKPRLQLMLENLPQLCSTACPKKKKNK